MESNKIRFRIVLPLVAIILGVLLFRWGDLQARKLIEQGGAFEGMPDIAATAKYVHYALNAPAWVTIGDTRRMLWGWSTYWTGQDLHYFLAVSVLWFLIGFKLDRSFAAKAAQHPPKKARWYRMLGWAYLLYGLFVCYVIVPEWSTRNLKFWVLPTLRLEHGWWFGVVGLGWGVGLVFVGLYSLFRGDARETAGESEP